MGIRTVFHKRVRRLATPAISFGADTPAIRSLADFDACLQQRRQLSDASCSRLAGLPASRQEREWQRSTRLYRGILDALLRIAEQGLPEEILWRELDLGNIPDENDWPAILLACSLDERLEPAWRQMAITAFLEYLRQRQQVLKRCLARSTGEAKDESPGLHESGLTAANAWLHGAERRIEDITRAAMTGRRKYRRLPYDFPVSLVLREDEAASIYLARWQVLLHWHGQSLFFAEGRLELLLSPGKNTVGRDPRCEVALHKAPADVSRRHLVIDWKGHGHVVLRDLSMKGSWVPRELLEDAD